jgi:ribosomal protein S3AE
MKMEQIKYSETSAYKIQTPGNYPEVNIQHTEHGESLKSRIVPVCLYDIKCFTAAFSFHFLGAVRMSGIQIRTEIPPQKKV